MVNEELLNKHEPEPEQEEKNPFEGEASANPPAEPPTVEVLTPTPAR